MEILTVTKENFEAEVIKSESPVLLDFWASWCGPCRMMSSVIDDVAANLGENCGRKIGKVNVDEQPELAQKFGVMSIPTLVLIRDGKTEQTSVGAKPKQFVLDLLDIK